MGAVALSWTRRKPNPTRVWTKATSPLCRTSSTAEPHKWPASCAGGLVFLAVFASCSSHLLVGNLGWPSLPGRKSTPSSTRGQRLTMALNKLGSTLSSTPQRPTRCRDMFWRVHDASARCEALDCVRCTACDCSSAALRLRLQGCVGAVLGTLEHTLHTRFRRWALRFWLSNVRSDKNLRCAPTHFKFGSSPRQTRLQPCH